MLDDKDLKNRILNEVKNEDIPDLSHEIVNKYQNKEVKTPWYKKGITWALGTPLILATGAACLAIAFIPKLNNPDNDDHISIVGPSIIGKQNQIAFGVLSMNNVLSYSLDNSSNTNNLVKKAISKEDLNEEEFKKEMNYLNPYMITSEAMLSSNLDLSPNVIELVGEEYQYQMEISAPGQDTLIFKYNEGTDLLQLKEIDESEDEDDESEDEKDDDSEEENDDELDNDQDEEQEFKLDGIILQGQTTYYVSGEKEFNNQEQEYELELDLYGDIEKKSIMMSIEQEFETEGNEKEQSYSLVQYENNKPTFEVELSFEGTSDDMQVDVEINEKNLMREYEIKKNNDNGFNIDYVYKNHSSMIDVQVLTKPGGDPNLTYYGYSEKTLGYYIYLPRN